MTSNGDAGMKSEETLSSETVFEGRVIGLRVDAVRLPNGRSGVREVVEHDESVVIVPVTGDGEVLLVRQYRYPVGEAILEAPAGGVDAGETPHECARRELREETGVRCWNPPESRMVLGEPRVLYRKNARLSRRRPDAQPPGA